MGSRISFLSFFFLSDLAFPQHGDILFFYSNRLL